MFAYFLSKNCDPPAEKGHLFFSKQTPSKNWDPVMPLHSFENLVIGLTLQAKRGVHTMNHIWVQVFIQAILMSCRWHKKLNLHKILL